MTFHAAEKTPTMRFPAHHGSLLLERRWRAIRGACFFRVGQTASPEAGTKPAIPNAPRGKTQSARLGRAIPGNPRERVDFLFLTVIADVTKKKKPSGKRRRATPSAPHLSDTFKLVDLGTVWIAVQDSAFRGKYLKNE